MRRAAFSVHGESRWRSYQGCLRHGSSRPRRNMRADSPRRTGHVRGVHATSRTFTRKYRTRSRSHDDSGQDAEAWHPLRGVQDGAQCSDAGPLAASGRWEDASLSARGVPPDPASLHPCPRGESRAVFLRAGRVTMRRVPLFFPCRLALSQCLGTDSAARSERALHGRQVDERKFGFLREFDRSGAGKLQLVQHRQQLPPRAARVSRHFVKRGRAAPPVRASSWTCACTSIARAMHWSELW